LPKSFIFTVSCGILSKDGGILFIYFKIQSRTKDLVQLVIQVVSGCGCHRADGLSKRFFQVIFYVDPGFSTAEEYG